MPFLLTLPWKVLSNFLVPALHLSVLKHVPLSGLLCTATWAGHNSREHHSQRLKYNFQKHEPLNLETSLIFFLFIKKGKVVSWKEYLSSLTTSATALLCGLGRVTVPSTSLICKIRGGMRSSLGSCPQAIIFSDLQKVTSFWSISYMTGSFWLIIFLYCRSGIPSCWLRILKSGECGLTVPILFLDFLSLHLFCTIKTRGTNLRNSLRWSLGVTQQLWPFRVSLWQRNQNKTQAARRLTSRQLRKFRKYSIPF